MRRLVIDSCAIDPIADVPGALDAVQRAVDGGVLEVLYTHVTIDELSGIRDEGRKQRLLGALQEIGRLVPTGAFVFDVSRFDMARLGSDEDVPVIEDLRSHNPEVHTRDALIGITAKVEGCAVLTNERQRFPNRARSQGIEVMSTDDLFAEIGFVPGSHRD